MKKLFFLAILGLLSSCGGNGVEIDKVDYDIITDLGNEDRLKEYIRENGVSVKNEFGGTLLHYAVYNKNLKAVSILVSEGANVNVIDEYLRVTPLYSSVNSEDGRIMDYLLRNGADPNFENLGEGEDFPILRASEYGDVSKVKKLLSYGADPNLKDGRGNDALIRASEKGNVKIVCILIEHDKDIATKNNNGLSAIDYAEEYDYSEILQVFKEDDYSDICSE